MLDPLLGEVCDRVVWPGRVELAAAMGAPSVVVRLVLGQDLWGARSLLGL